MHSHLKAFFIFSLLVSLTLSSAQAHVRNIVGKSQTVVQVESNGKSVYSESECKISYAFNGNKLTALNITQADAHLTTWVLWLFRTQNEIAPLNFNTDYLVGKEFQKDFFGREFVEVKDFMNKELPANPEAGVKESIPVGARIHARMTVEGDLDAPKKIYVEAEASMNIAVILNFRIKQKMICTVSSVK